MRLSQMIGSLTVLEAVVGCLADRSTRHPSVAFAGGFGKQKLPGTKSKKNKKKRRGFLEVDAPSQQTRNKDTKEEVQLDKWGLPVNPTEEEMFPPLHPQTKLLQSPPKQGRVIETIENAMKDHVSLNFERFSQDGFEINPQNEPMKLSMLHFSPPVLCIENFLTASECDDIREVSTPGTKEKAAIEVGSATFSAMASTKRTSTSWFCHYAQCPTLLAKVQYLLGMTLENIEEPQIVRYRTREEFTWHYDEVPGPQLENGGQRVATFLVYLNDLMEGGATTFRDLKDVDGSPLSMKPKKGSALLFFPAFADGKPDDRTLHRGEPALETKWITQLWLHQAKYLPAIPPGNSHTAALEAIQQSSKGLGY